MPARTTQITPVEVRRRALGLSKKELGEKAGVSRRTIASIESGNLPQMRIALKVARALDRTLEELFLDEEQAS